MRYIELIFVVTASILFLLDPNQGSCDVRFSEIVIDSSFDAVSIYACDMDGDLDIDVMAAGIESGIALWRNEGDYPVSWTKSEVDGSFIDAISVFAADIDGDQDMDIVAASWYRHDIAWWRNDGGDPFNWTRFLIDENFLNAHEVYVEDLDGDGAADVLGAAAGDNDIAWWHNDGGDPVAWTKYVIDGACGGARSVFAGDIDRDGDKDVISACFSTDEVLWYRNDGGDPIIWSEFPVSGNFNGAHKVIAHDLDRDGDPDILGAAYMGSDIAWWRNDGGDPVAWEMQIIDDYFAGALTLYPADFDNDGNTDVVGAGDISDDIAWWRNDGSEPPDWFENTIEPFYNGAWPVFARDIDGDGDIDVLSGSNIIWKISLWENDLVTAVDEFSSTRPDDRLMADSYPNPFNSTTAVRFNLPLRSDVEIRIYDMLGRLVDTVVRANLPPGRHQIILSAENRTSGLYFYVLRATELSAAGKMILLK